MYLILPKHAKNISPDVKRKKQENLWNRKGNEENERIKEWSEGSGTMCRVIFLSCEVSVAYAFNKSFSSPLRHPQFC